MESKSTIKNLYIYKWRGTPYNNPAFLMYRMATWKTYNLNWETGEKNLLIVSVGTISAPIAGAYSNILDTLFNKI